MSHFIWTTKRLKHKQKGAPVSPEDVCRKCGKVGPLDAEAESICPECWEDAFRATRRAWRRFANSGLKPAKIHQQVKNSLALRGRTESGFKEQQ